MEMLLYIQLMVDPVSIKYALIYEHINQEMGVDQIITEQLSIYLTRHLLYIDLETQCLGRTIIKPFHRNKAIIKSIHSNDKQ